MRWHRVLGDLPDRFKKHVRSMEHEQGFENFMDTACKNGDDGKKHVKEYFEEWSKHHHYALKVLNSLKATLERSSGRQLTSQEVTEVRTLFENVETCRLQFQKLDERFGVHSRMSNSADIACHQWWHFVCKKNQMEDLEQRLIIQGKDHGSKVTVHNAENATNKIFVYLQDEENDRDTPAPIGFDSARNEAIWKKPEELISQRRPKHPLFRIDSEGHTVSSPIPQHYRFVEASNSAVNVSNTTSIIEAGEEINSQDHKDNESFKTANSS